MTADRSDTDLMHAHVAGDPYAFTELVQRHQGKLYAVAVRTLHNREDAADALQDALLSAYRASATWRAEAKVSTWLYRVVINACLDRIRRNKVRATEPMPEREPAAPRDDYSRSEARLVLDQALAQLPEPQRAAITLVDLYDLSVAEAAEILDVPAGTVKSRCARGRAALAELLADDADTTAGEIPSSHADVGNQSRPKRVRSLRAKQRPDREGGS